MLRKVLSIISFVVSGFFLYISIFSAFLRYPEELALEVGFDLKLFMLGLFLIPALLTLLLGLALRSFSRWQRVCGVVFLSTAAFCAFVFLTIICMIYSPGFETFRDQEIFSMLSDLASGVGFFSLILSSGAVLYYKGGPT
jgi:hypothetical protein